MCVYKYRYNAHINIHTCQSYQPLGSRSSLDTMRDFLFGKQTKGQPCQARDSWFVCSLFLGSSCHFPGAGSCSQCLGRRM